MLNFIKGLFMRESDEPELPEIDFGGGFTMEQHPTFEPFDPFQNPEPLQKPIHLDLGDFDSDAGEAAPRPRFHDVSQPTAYTPPPSAERSEPAPRPARPVERPVERELPRQSPPRVPMPTVEDEALLDTDVYERVRQMVEMKWSFMYTCMGLALVNAVMGTLAYFVVLGPEGKLWFVWPLGFSALYLLYRFVKVYLMNGMDLRSIKERRVKEMTLREIRRQRIHGMD